LIELRHDDGSDASYDPFDDAWNGRITHKQQSDNPFAINNWKFSEWEIGWLAADEVIQKEEQKPTE
jgi:hypothetical protein